ncbi:hypothetical protein D3C77_463610 [compost metagenome]
MRNISAYISMALLDRTQHIIKIIFSRITTAHQSQLAFMKLRIIKRNFILHQANEYNPSAMGGQVKCPHHRLDVARSVKDDRRELSLRY